jgi:hypothetical protein
MVVALVEADTVSLPHQDARILGNGTAAVKSDKRPWSPKGSG